MKARRCRRSRRYERFESCGRRFASICTPSPGRPVARPCPAPGSAPGIRMREKVSATASRSRGRRASWAVPATGPCTPPSTTPRRCSTWAFPSPRFRGQSFTPNLCTVIAPTAVLHIAALHATKEWPLDRFRRVGHFLEGRGLEPVFISAPGRGDMFSGLSRFTCLEDLTLNDLKSLIAGARLFVGNDSGPAHVAAAFAIPTVVIFGSSNSCRLEALAHRKRGRGDGMGLQALQGGSLLRVRRAALYSVGGDVAGREGDS